VFVADPQAAQFSSLFENEMGSGSGVRVSEVVTDTRDPEKRYMPGHPDADKDGYVAYPRMNPAQDMVDLLGASRGYQANVSAVSAVKDMIQRSLDLFK
jgi:flagellar basal-body rod protein FlgC